MLRKTVSGIMLTLILMGMLTLAFNVQPVKATGTIYIRADGSIDPPTAPIERNGNIYTLTGDIINSSIVVGKDHITLDGVGYTVQGAGWASDSKGVDLAGRKNVTIRNMEIRAFDNGVYLNFSSENTIVGNNIAENFHGIYFWGYSSNNSIVGNNITTNNCDGCGIWVDWRSDYNNIYGNNLTANNTWGYWGLGIYLSGSSNNNISRNIFVNDGLFVIDSYGNEVQENFVNGKPLVYLENVSNHSVDDAGQVILILCNNIRLENLNLSETSIGVELWGANASKIANNNIAKDLLGILLCYHSSNNCIDGNNITKNNSGIDLLGSNNINISGNNVANNNYGIHTALSSNVNISRNNVTSNTCALATGYGISLECSSNISIVENTIASNDQYGISLSQSSNGVIYHNNFINNTGQLYAVESLNLTWDDGYPSGGNYWSDYEGRYPNAMEVDDSGIWNTPYVIDESNQDNYPLIHPYGSVQNLNTSLTYLTIQSAINAPETLHGHTIFVRNGTYYENVVVNKTLSLIGESAGSTIIDGNYTGITVDITKPFVRIEKFTIQHGHRYGVHFGSDNAAVIDNILMNNTIAMGCWIMDTVWSDGDIIENNSLVGNGYGIFFYWTSYSTICSNNVSCTIPRNEGGIFIYGPYANVISKNSLHSGGIYFVTNPSSNNIITENNFYAGGITLPGALSMGPNVIYHNNFFSGKVQGASQIQNQLDNGYPSGGNYWSDYAGLDLCSGPYQNETGSDGIGDTPYVINADNTDNYPLMKPYAGLYDIGITNVTTLKTIVGQGYNLTIIIKILNYGMNTETFNLTLYANTSIIQSLTNIVLTSRSSTTITFTWNTSGFTKGNYTITAYAWPVPGETHTEDNTLPDGWVIVTIPGDVNGDRLVDISDLVITVGAIPSAPGWPNWNPNVDINGDGVCDISDLVICVGSIPSGPW